MPFQTVPLPVVGGTNENRSKFVNSALTKNWYPEVTQGGRASSCLLPWWGTKAFGTSPGTSHRGRHVFKDQLYQVVDTTLYRISSTGNYTSIGTILGDGRCVLDSNSDYMVIVSSGNVYSYDGSTLTKATDTDFESPTGVTMLNNQFIYDGNTDRFCVSDVGAPLDIDSLNYATASSRGDNLIRPYAFKQWVYLFGESSIEPWYNTGVGNPPFDRIDNGIMEKGLGATYSLAHSDDYLYFYGDDGNVYQIIQTQVRNITPPAIAYQMARLDKTNCYGNVISLDGQQFYIIQFGADELTYAYSEQTQAWFNLSTGVSNGRYIGTDLVSVYDKIIGFSLGTSNAIELDKDTYTDLGNVIERERVLPPINSANLGLGAGKRMLTDGAKLILETGQGIATGQGSFPQIMVQASKDGGRTFSTERWIETGQMGDFLVNVEYYEMISFYDLVLKIKVSDPVFSSLHDGSIRLKLDGY